MALGDKLRDAMERLRKSAFGSPEEVKAAVKDLQRALIGADVDVNLVLNLSKEVEKRATSEPPKGVSRREWVLKQTHDLLSELLGGHHAPPSKPKRILLVGLFGQGKTTTAAKLAQWYQKRGQSTALVGADVHRPASFEQLQQLSKKVDAAFYGNKKEKDAAKIVQEALKDKEVKARDVIVVDAAGRSALDEKLTQELRDIAKAFKPDQVWLVLSADIGQLAHKQAKAFQEAVKVTGVVLSKMDGSAKGGGALAACAQTQAPVYFIGTGEKPQDLEPFDASRYLSRIMGYGDLQGLLEKVKDVVEEEEFSPEDLMKGEFTLKTFYKQLEATRKMGPLSKVTEMLGLKANIPQEHLDVTEEKLDEYKVMMDSMTEQELKDPGVFNRSRVIRVSAGSGFEEKDVRELLKRHKQMKKMVKTFQTLGKGKKMRDAENLDVNKLLKQFQGKKKKFRLR